jgi:hypothetical protein
MATIATLNNEGSLSAVNISEMPSTTNLVLYLDAGDSGSIASRPGTWKDISGNNNHFNYYLSNWNAIYVQESASMFFYNDPTASVSQVVVATASFDQGVMKRIQDEFTIEAVFKMTRTNDIGGVITGRWGFHGGIHTNGNTFYTQLWFVSASVVTAVSQLLETAGVNKWAHVTLVWEYTTSTTGTMKSYYNGNLFSSTAVNIQDSGSNAYPAMYDYSNIYSVGGYGAYASGVIYYVFNGYISVVGAWNRVLTDAEIRQNFNLYKDRFGI